MEWFLYDPSLMSVNNAVLKQQDQDLMGRA